MKIAVPEVKRALADPAFRRTLPPELQGDVQQYEQNPGCACNLPVYRRILKYAAKQLREYYPGREVQDPDREKLRTHDNKWTVINCAAQDLERRLRGLPPGKKYVSLGRHQEQVTVIVNDVSEGGELIKNYWTVINCAVKDLEARLKSLPPGRKFVSIARYEDQVTVVIDEPESA